MNPGFHSSAKHSLAFLLSVAEMPERQRNVRQGNRTKANTASPQKPPKSSGTLLLVHAFQS